LLLLLILLWCITFNLPKFDHTVIWAGGKKHFIRWTKWNTIYIVNMSHVLLTYNIIVKTLASSICKWFFTDLKYIDSVISTSCSDELSTLVFAFLPWNRIYTSQMTILNDSFIHKVCCIDLPYWPLFILWAAADIITGWIEIKLPNCRKMTFHCKGAQPIIYWFVKLPALNCVIIACWE